MAGGHGPPRAVTVPVLVRGIHNKDGRRTWVSHKLLILCGWLGAGNSGAEPWGPRAPIPISSLLAGVR